MRVLVGVALAGVLVTAGCRFTADYAGTHYRCGPADECPAGFTCVAGFCETGAADAAAQTDGPVADAPPDAPEPDGPTDAAGEEASPAEDGGTDGGGDAPDGPPAQDAQSDAAQSDAAQADAQQDAGVACGKTAALADNFNDNSMDIVWSNAWQGAATYGEIGGELAITLAGNTPGAYAGYQTLGYYDLTESSFSVQIKQMANTSTNAQAYIVLEYDSSHSVGFTQEAGSLIAKQQSTALHSAAWDPAAHRYWRIRESAGTLYWETSSNGSSWNAFHSISSPSWLGYVMISLAGGTYDSVANPGQIRFDNVNGGTTTAALCPVGTLQDDFADNSPGILWENRYQDNGATYAESGGVASITPSSTGSSDAAYASARLYDLRGGALSVEVPSLAANVSGVQTFIGVQHGWDDGLVMVYEQGTLYFRTQVGGSYTSVGTLTYNATDHRWWRIAEQGGTSSWWTSPDGVAWTQRASIANPVPLDSVLVVMGALTWKTVAAPGTATFDNVNRTP